MISGARAQQLRELMGLTQTSLAELAGVSQPTVARIEGHGEVAEDLVDKVARALNATSNMLMSRPPLVISHSTAARFRAHSDLRAWERQRAHRWAEIAYELLLHLRGKVRFPEAAKLDIDVMELRRSAVGRDVEPAEEAAVAARLALDLRPATPLPDLVRTLEKAGVRVLPLPLDGKLHAGLSLIDGLEAPEPLVFLFRGVPADRQRFTLAHELGHLVLHHEGADDRRVAEQEANRFAAAFLMPAPAFLDDLRSMPATLSTFLHLKPRWGASIASMVSRAWELGRITDWQRRRLMSDLSAKGWRTQEPSPLPHETPGQLQKAVTLAYGDPPAVDSLANDLKLPRQVVAQLLADLVPSLDSRPGSDNTVVEFTAARRRRRPDSTSVRGGHQGSSEG